MALEKRWIAVAPQLFTSNGTVDGMLTVADSKLFKVKQHVKISSAGEPSITLQVKRIDSDTVLYLGSSGENIHHRSDISAYTVVGGATISAEEQNKAVVGPDDATQAAYEQEPTVAFRNILVDQCGNPVGLHSDNPFYVQLSDGSITIGTVNAELEVQLTHLDDDPDAGDVHDSIRIGDGQDLLAINPDGSINVSSASGTTPLIQNVVAASAATEYSVVLPISTKRFQARLRSPDNKPVGRLQIAYVSGQSGTNYVSVPPGASFEPSADLNLGASLTIYFQTNKNGNILEVESWT